MNHSSSRRPRGGVPSSSSLSSSISRGSSSRRSKLYERYNVNIKQQEIDDDEQRRLQQHQRQDNLPIEERSNIELIKIIILQNIPKSHLTKATILLGVAVIISYIILPTNNDANINSATTGNVRSINYNKNNYMAVDSHERNNPFAEEGHISVMTGALETKRIGGNSQQSDNWKVCPDCEGLPIGGGKQQPQQQQSQSQQQLQQQQTDDVINDPKFLEQTKHRKWNPCTYAKYSLERHSHESRHGDVCRIIGDNAARLYKCPEGCHDIQKPPYCVNDKPQQYTTLTIGSKDRPCRVQHPIPMPEYRCDLGSVCIMAPSYGLDGTDGQQFKGQGEYYDETCNNKCRNGLSDINNNNDFFQCTRDIDCSLAGVCLPNGTCQCDPWTTGIDCSYLNFQPVNKSRMGYIDEEHSSWGGSIIQRTSTTLNDEGNATKYVMYTSEILCDDYIEEEEQPQVVGLLKKKNKKQKKRRCGLNNWETLSRIVRTESNNIDGPYKRVNHVVLPPMHHNPSVHVSPITNHWHLYTISGSTGPIVRMISSDEGQSWDIPRIQSPRQNPGPLLNEDGSTYLYYRADGMDLPSPTCSLKGIAMQICQSDDQACNPPNDKPIFDHTGEDPSVFKDHRGNYHMLFNALPYKCVPKLLQGGHAWSTDGINWSTPRIGAFNTTIQFTDDTSMTCERRERPQMVLDKDKKPIALVTGVTGCPRGEADTDGSWKKYYRGGDDSFTLVQLMMNP